MSILGSLSRTPPLTIEEVEVAGHTEMGLRKWEPRTLRNPFTGQPTLETIFPGQFEINVAGRVVGAIGPSAEFEDDGEIDISIGKEEDLPDVKEVIMRLAERLGAAVTWFDEPV